MTTLVLVRHGQSEWNLQNRFTGWVDVNLTEKGVAEAIKGGQMLATLGLRFDEAYTSYLTRAIRTLWFALEQLDQCYIPVIKDWRLNERHYGGLTGLNKQETREKHGDEQVHIWRRSFDIPPPIIGPDHQYHPANDPRYHGIDPAILPGGESLKMTLERVLPYFEAVMAPKIRSGRTLLVSAHGNSLRALLKHLFHVSDKDIPGFECPTGNPLVIDLQDGTLDVISARYLDQDRAKPIPPIA
ncbi:MAG TPA: 2,3-diphosphoglycerate-dependent phosphoglycerate mutase [Hellea balneolensis]|uniref:2,3-bisphosphoglycerate-dependent phosphoglycerate mutase n=1 Tax=Hellea balneolensis TaxID=287478 RepID=A0A7C5R014_9PROT|nr:2,3-diphosphoglycerate-dependent phosphoglycerate mutase [Hellea balneolensis]